MKLFKHFILIILISLTFKNAISQNVAINVVTQNSGVVKKGELIYFQIDINNTSATKVVSKYKLRPQISFPTTLVGIQETGHVLPNGWVILSNANGVITFSNGTDIINPNESRRILVSIKGNRLGGPSTIAGNLLFSNGIKPGIVSGVSTVGDNLGDNTSTSTVMVVK